jgi:hypothetical protein
LIFCGLYSSSAGVVRIFAPAAGNRQLPDVEDIMFGKFIKFSFVFAGSLFLVSAPSFAESKATGKKARTYCGLPLHIIGTMESTGYVIGSRKPVSKPNNVISNEEWNRYLSKIKTCRK